ncbi:MAG TPA: adenine nucleotide alpha hydrolase [Bacteroidales bacterium]|nr:adenine nucleotide alpha hydrolase [Bacteroidales bacterium]
MTPVLFCWSSGKDSAMALHILQESNEYEIRALLTTVYKPYSRISMHGIHEDLLRKQVQHLGIPLRIVYMNDASNMEYENTMHKTLLEFKQQGIDTVAFGDIFLEDLREYREQQLQKVDMKALFPLWKKNTLELSQYFTNHGFKSIVCCVNDAELTEHHVGVNYNSNFVSQLPSSVDPCGEHGEFHTFCYDGPIFTSPVPIVTKDICYKPLEKNSCTMPYESKTKGFWYCNIEYHPTPNP